MWLAVKTPPKWPIVSDGALKLHLNSNFGASYKILQEYQTCQVGEFMVHFLLPNGWVPRPFATSLFSRSQFPHLKAY